MLCRALGAQRLAETSIGVSTLYLAAAVRDNGGGVIGSEIVPEKVAFARRNLEEAGWPSSSISGRETRARRLRARRQAERKGTPWIERIGPRASRPARQATRLPQGADAGERQRRRPPQPR
jgi:hypothetical protein